MQELSCPTDTDGICFVGSMLNVVLVECCKKSLSHGCLFTGSEFVLMSKVVEMFELRQESQTIEVGRRPEFVMGHLA